MKDEIMIAAVSVAKYNPKNFPWRYEAHTVVVHEAMTAGTLESEALARAIQRAKQEHPGCHILSSWVSIVPPRQRLLEPVGYALVHHELEGALSAETMRPADAESALCGAFGVTKESVREFYRDHAA